MIRANSVLRPGQVGYYLAPVRNGVEPAGRWVGSAAEALGLTGEVAEDALVNLTWGRSPGGERLIGRRPDQVGGRDLTFGVPKSVSVLWAVSDPEVAEQVEKARSAALEATVAYLEAGAIRSQGAASDGLVGASFAHRTSRAGDPHLHTHLVVVNLTPLEDGRWRAISNPSLSVHLAAAGFLFEAHLRAELTGRLGVGWSDVVNGVAQLAGVPQLARTEFSRRRAQVEQNMAARGGRTPASARLAALDGRPERDMKTTVEDRLPGWRDRAARAGFGPAERAAIVDPKLARGSEGRSADMSDDLPRLASVVERVGEASSFSRRDVLKAVCAEASQGCLIQRAEAIADAVLSSEGVVELQGSAALRLSDVMVVGSSRVVVGAVDDLARWSTAEEVAAQRRLGQLARAGRGAGVETGLGVVEPAAGAAVDAVVDAVEVARRVLSSGDRVQLVSAPSPTGRAALVDELRAGLAPSARAVVALGTNASEAAELSAVTGVATSSYDAALEQWKKGARGLEGAMVVVVGADAITARSLVEVLEVADRSSASVVMVSAPGGLRYDDRAGGWRALASACRVMEIEAGVGARGDQRTLEGAAQRPAHVPDPVGHGTPEAIEVVRVGDLLLLGTSEQLRDRVAMDLVAARRAGDNAVVVVRHRSDAADLVGRVQARGGIDDRGGLDELSPADIIGTSYEMRRRSPGRVLAMGDPASFSRPGELPACPALYYAVADLAREPGLARAGTAERVVDRQVDPQRLASEDLASLHERVMELRLRLGTGALGERRPAWVADNAGALAELSTASSAVSARRAALARAAELKPPGYLIEVLGEPPGDPNGRSRWRQAAGEIEAYRERWRVTDMSAALGPQAVSSVQRAHQNEVSRALSTASRSLGHERPSSLELGLDRLPPERAR